MMTQETEKVRKQMQMVCIDDLVPRNHLLRLIDKAIDWTFIYDLVRDTYSDGMGRPSIDPVTLIKIPLIQYLYGIKSMRQTIKEIEVNMAYRWFLGLELYDPVPHFSTFGKNYTRRFKDTDLFEQIFQRILEECYRFKLVDSTEIFVDATHVKARANNRKMQKRIAKQEALFYADMLRQDINADREAHGKKPLKDKTITTNLVPVATTSLKIIRMMFRQMKKQLSVALQILRAAGFGKASTSMCLLMGLKQHAIKMDGLLILQ